MLPFEEFEKRFLKNPDADEFLSDVSPDLIEEILSIDDLDETSDEQLATLIKASGGVEEFLEIRSLRFELDQATDLADINSDGASGIALVNAEESRVAKINAIAAIRARNWVEQQLGPLSKQVIHPTGGTTFHGGTETFHDGRGSESGLNPFLNQSELLAGLSFDDEIIIGKLVCPAVINELNSRLTQLRQMSLPSDMVEELIRMFRQRQELLAKNCSDLQQAVYWLENLEELSSADLAVRLRLAVEQIEAAKATVERCLEEQKAGRPDSPSQL